MGILLTQRSGFIIGNIAKILGFIMNGIYEFLNNFGMVNIGLCIIIFTIVIYTLMLPLTIKQQKFTRLSAVMNPELQAINKKYANKKDQASMMKMQEETKLVYEKYGTTPTGGCLGSLIQLPILFALWPVVQNIPAYVSSLKEAYMPLVNGIMATDGFQKTMETFGTLKTINISPERFDYSKANTMVDILYKFQDSNWNTLAEKFPSLSEMVYSTKENISHMSYFLGFNIAETPSTMLSTGIKTATVGLIVASILIPVLAGATQLLSVKIAQSATKNTRQDQDNAMVQQMDMMMKIMPLMSVFFCFSMPSGLGLYWITSAVVRTIQQFFVNKSLDKKSLDDLVKENMERAAKKRANKKEVEKKEVNTMAHMSTKNIESAKKKTTSNNNIDSYKKDAKPGSLASKANMVSDFNNRK